MVAPTIFGSIPTIVWTWLELSGAGGMKFRKRTKDESFKLFNPPVNEDVADTRDVYKKTMKDRINGQC